MTSDVTVSDLLAATTNLLIINKVNSEKERRRTASRLNKVYVYLSQHIWHIKTLFMPLTYEILLSEFTSWTFRFIVIVRLAFFRYNSHFFLYLRRSSNTLKIACRLIHHSDAGIIWPYGVNTLQDSIRSQIYSIRHLLSCPAVRGIWSIICELLCYYM